MLRGGQEDRSPRRFPGPARFEAASITSPTGSVIALHHTDRPIVAFTGTPPVAGRPVSDFVDPPAYADVFEAYGFQVLTPDALNTPSGELDLTDLAPIGPSDLRYWRPDVLGDVLFNWWD
ncbi:hypothetical protein ACFY94_07955 [Streptomyces griseorubiginosus]|uniref:hypothetical protein n=1 Tax=Streptomyces griseorubiginosus TaxID=67304 RepID=UPI0036EC1F4C